jgi:hypothetical protein
LVETVGTSVTTIDYDDRDGSLEFSGTACHRCQKNSVDFDWIRPTGPSLHHQ